MPLKKHKPEEIIGKLREVEIMLGQGGTTAEACRRIAVSEQTYYRWRKEYGGLKTDQARRMKDLEKENARLRRAISDLTLDKLILQEAAKEILEPRTAPALHRPGPGGAGCVRAARVPCGQHRSTQRKVPCGANDEQALTDDVVALAKQYGRYGYRRVTALLHAAGWSVNHKRVERIWRREGLKVPQRQPKRGRLWLNDGSCIRLRPEYPGHVWAYDFVEERTHDGRKFRILTIIDEASASAWHWSCHVNCATKTCWPRWPTCSSNAVRQRTSDRQWQRVHRHRRPDLARTDRREDALHRPGLAMGERL
jgi:transposase-like protein